MATERDGSSEASVPTRSDNDRDQFPHRSDYQKPSLQALGDWGTFNQGGLGSPVNGLD